MERQQKFRAGDIIEVDGRQTPSDRVYVVQNVNVFDGSLYCFDEPKCWFVIKDPNSKPCDPMPSFTVEAWQAKKVGHVDNDGEYAVLVYDDK